MPDEKRVMIMRKAEEKIRKYEIVKSRIQLRVEMLKTIIESTRFPSDEMTKEMVNNYRKLFKNEPWYDFDKND